MFQWLARLFGGGRAPAEPDDSCIACGHAPVEEVHPDAWRCPSCGYEQGPGWQRRADVAELEALLQLSPAEARAQVLAWLEEVALLLSSAEGPLANPVLVVSEGRSGGHVEINSGLNAAEGYLREAHKLLERAALIDDEARAHLAGARLEKGLPPTDGLCVRSPDEVEATASVLAVVGRRWKVAANETRIALG